MSPPLSVYQARVYKTFTTIPTQVVVAFELHIDIVGMKPVTGGDSFADISLGSDYTIALVANSDNVSYTEDVSPGDGGLDVAESTKVVTPTSTILGSWALVALDLDIANKTLTVSINKTPLLPAVLISPPSGLPVTVYVGTRARNVASQVAGHYDNVTIDVITP